MFIDTHAHLWWESYQDDVSEVVARARVAGVEKIIVPGTNVVSSTQALSLAQKYPNVIYPAVGIHPEDVVGANVAEVERLITDNRDCVVAVGEIGIDLFAEKEQQTLEEQKELFKAQCELALKFDLPVIIHTRDSFAQTWEVLQSLPTMPRGQFHCFSVDEAALNQVLAAGFSVSFCGNIAWSKRVAKLVPLVPLDRLLLETDSPFMLPKERNEPANVTMIAQIICELRGMPLDELSRRTTANAIKLFSL